MPIKPAVIDWPFEPMIPAFNELPDDAPCTVMPLALMVCSPVPVVCNAVAFAIAATLRLFVAATFSVPPAVTIASCNVMLFDAVRLTFPVVPIAA